MNIQQDGQQNSPTVFMGDAGNSILGCAWRILSALPARRFWAVIASAALAATPTAQATTTVFSDTFESGSASSWTKSTNFAGTTSVIASAKSHTGLFGLETFLEVPPQSGSNLFVRASHEFTAPVSATYTLDLWARSTPCSGCTISYDVLVDGVSLARTFAPTGFEQRTFSLPGVAAGAHTLTLGMFTTQAVSGHFFAAFDDISISTAAAVPEPETYALLLAGLGLIGVAIVRRRRSNEGVSVPPAH